MKNNKTDQRSRYTQAVVRKHLLNLLSQKPLKSVTVAELCRAAGVTRGTFYNHFYDVFDVYESIESEFLEELKSRLDEIKIYALERSFIREIMIFISDNRELVSLIVSEISESTLLKQILHYVRTKYVSEFLERYPDVPGEQIDTLFVYTINGAIGVLADWIKKGMEQSPERIAEQIDRFNQIVVEHFFN